MPEVPFVHVINTRICLVAFDLFYFDYYAYFMQAKLDPGELSLRSDAG